MTESDSVTIEEVMEKRKMTRSEIMNHITYIFTSETKYGIYFILDLYEMLNLKTLAKLLGKSASTIHAHLEDLSERGYIQVANTVKGKYYEITSFMKDIKNLQREQFEERDIEKEIADLKEMSDERFLETTLDKFDDLDSNLTSEFVIDYAELMSNASSTMRTMAQISITSTGESFFHIYLIYLLRLILREQLSKLESEFEILRNHSKHGQTIKTHVEKHKIDFPLSLPQYRELIMAISEKKYREILESFEDGTLTMTQVRRIMPIGSNDLADYSLKLSSIDQLARYFEVFIKFHRDLRRLDQEFEKENEGIPEELLTTQLVNLFTGPLGKM